MMELIFIPLINNEEFCSVHYRYLINAMIEYQRLLYMEDIPIEPETSTECLKCVIAHKEFQYLQMLMQYQSFPKTLEVAHLLAQAFNNGCTEIMQVVVDAFYNMREPLEAIRMMVKGKKLAEVLQYVERFKLRGVRAREILQAAQELPAKERNQYFAYFSRVNVSIVVIE
eukprot:TRINITY_DN13497_c0_g1_i10.p1 TRINITY_DN13497_c0_g1~~TRINITY_DN13497_c0_g1_i10.p1  ORF type:complete len:170 (-),score=53.99 TRINITY_DN13497_c0_g1_i10:200-709(-)